jgi:hypothetical protein
MIFKRQRMSTFVISISRETDHLNDYILSLQMQEADIDGDQHVSFEEFRCDFTKPTLQRQYTENLKQIFPEMKLRGLSPSSYIHVSVSNLYIPMIGLPILLQEKRWTDRGNIYKSLTET